MPPPIAKTQPVTLDDILAQLKVKDMLQWASSLLPAPVGAIATTVSLIDSFQSNPSKGNGSSVCSFGPGALWRCQSPKSSWSFEVSNSDMSKAEVDSGLEHPPPSPAHSMANSFGIFFRISVHM